MQAAIAEMRKHADTWRYLVSAFTLANEMDSDVSSLRVLLLERERLAARLAELGSLIAAALADPDTDMTGVRVTERRDIRVKVVDQDALDSYLFRTGRHKLVTSTIRLPGATEQALYDALQMVQGVVGPTGATAARTINTGSIEGAAPQDAPRRRGAGWARWRLRRW